MKTIQLGFVGMALLAAACGANGADSTASTGSDESITDDHVGTALRVTQTNLVSDQPGVAVTTDPNAVNVWGISFNPAGPAWVSNNGTGTTEVITPVGADVLTVVVPTPAYVAADAGVSSTPTGQVFNASATDFGGDKFIFVTEDGTVSGWQPSTGAVLHDDYSSIGAVFKGVGLGPSMIYVADFHNDVIDVFDATYKQISVAGGFEHPALPKGYAPFNVFVDGTQVFVAYAKQDKEKHDDAKGYGNGYVDLFDTAGNFQSRLISRGVLDSPWGMAIAPASFGKLAGALLVGNTGNGFIHAFTLSEGSYGGTTATYAGYLADTKGKELFIDNLWGIAVSPAPDQNRLYFSAGPESESHGLYGRLDVPGDFDAGTPDAGQ
jgi:uncharacterized protein (TIGR03118 family)